MQSGLLGQVGLVNEVVCRQSRSRDRVPSPHSVPWVFIWLMKKLRHREVKSPATESVIGRAELGTHIGLSLSRENFFSPLLMLLGEVEIF